jgi:spore maturation protein CgeB
MNNAMLDSFHKANSKRAIDIVVGYGTGYTIDPNSLLKMGKAGAVILNFSWDDKLGFRGKMLGGRWTGPAALASVVDLNLTNAPESCIKYLVEGGLAKFWPEAAHPDIHKPYDLPFEFDVSFVGSKYGWRPKFVSKLRKMGINIICFGNGWENGPLSDEEMVKLYSRSKINLGFAGVGHSRKLMCLKGRDFEVPMSGGLYLTQDNPELSLVYDVGNEIMIFEDELDCAEKIIWLLAHPDEADKIRQAGEKKALGYHHWKNRFDDVFRMSGILK